VDALVVSAIDGSGFFWIASEFPQPVSPLLTSFS
jgi:hypothetical protein